MGHLILIFIDGTSLDSGFHKDNPHLGGAENEPSYSLVAKI
jgi:hypothetical protein